MRQKVFLTVFAVLMLLALSGCAGWRQTSTNIIAVAPATAPKIERRSIPECNEGQDLYLCWAELREFSAWAVAVIADLEDAIGAARDEAARINEGEHETD